MDSHLSAAFEIASKLPPDQQEAFAAFLMAELKDESEWKTTFESSVSSLKNLAKEATTEYRAGACEPLDDLLK